MNTTKHKMLNGLCVPASTPDDYFETSARQWITHHRQLVKAGKTLQAFDQELADARNEAENPNYKP